MGRKRRGAFVLNGRLGNISLKLRTIWGNIFRPIGCRGASNLVARKAENPRSAGQIRFSQPFISPLWSPLPRTIRCHPLPIPPDRSACLSHRPLAVCDLLSNLKKCINIGILAKGMHAS